MRWLRFAVFVLVVTILQTSVVGAIAVTAADIKPNLLVVLLVFFAIYADPTEAVITSFVIGFAADIIGPSTMGPNIISFGLIGTLLADMNRAITLGNRLHQGIAIFAAGFLTTALAYLLAFFKAESFAYKTYAQFFWIPLYSALLGPLLFLPLAWLMRIKIRKRKT